jgi:outer membrane autotransporter protein
MNQIDVSSINSNFQSMMFDTIGSVNVNLSEGNVNNGIIITNGGSASIINSANINQTFTFSGTGSFSLNNTGILNNGLTVTGDGTHSVTSSNFINQTLTFNGNGNDSVNNSGTINPGINKNGGGTLNISNALGATINQGVFVNGSSQTTISNFGTIQGAAISLGTGNDLIINNGTINGETNMGDGNNTFLMQSGRVNGNVLQGAGSDSVVISGGEITGTVRTGAGNDTLLWTGGLVGGIDMGAGDDRATLQNLTATNLRTITIDGGQGNDALTLVNTTADRPDRLVNWELIQLMQNSQLTMNADLTLGDSGTGTGMLTIDSTSTLLAGQQQRSILPFTAGQLVTVVNAGTIDLTNGGTSTTDRLFISGNYIGQNGRLLLQSVLAGNASPSDRLVVSGGQMSGNTAIGITNVGGQGALTLGNGILVVQAVNGATTTGSAFSLSGRVAAGAFEYQLFRGGFVNGSGSNWYLRNFIPPTPVVPPTPGPPDGSGGNGTGGGGGGGGGGGTDNGGGDNGSAAISALDPGGAGGIILYRPEVALAAVVPEVARAAVRSTLGTFHDREGEQAFASGDGGFKAGWARLFGGSYRQTWSGDVNPSFSGSIWGIQAGFPVLGLEHSSGEKDRAGLFFAYANANGSVAGFALGQQGAPVGNLGVNIYSVGAYWTHFWPAGGYLDAVLMESWMTASTQSVSNVSSTDNGRMFTASLELGYPIPIFSNWAIEPQAQFIYQRWGNDLYTDPFAQISESENNFFTGRFGTRVVANFVTDKMTLKPFVLANLWHGFGGQDTTPRYDADRQPPSGSAIEFGGGLSASAGTWADVYAKVSYTTAIDGISLNSLSGRFGFRLTW